MIGRRGFIARIAATCVAIPMLRNIACADLPMEALRHIGDSDTHVSFKADKIELVAGGVTLDCWMNIHCASRRYQGFIVPDDRILV